MRIDLPYNYKPRWYQLNGWNALYATGSKEGNPETDARRAYCLDHRRAGKDLNWFNLMQVKIKQRVGLYAHIFPTLKEGRRVIWNGMNREGRRFLDYIPGQTEFARTKRTNWVVRKRDDDMTIEYANGSIYTVLGADDPDSVRGNNFVGVLMSEYAFFKGPQVWDIIRPMLAENGGWMAAITTPDGRNHGHALHMRFKALAEKGDPIYYTETLPASFTGAVDPARIQEDRDSGMSEAKIESEYECSYDAPVEGSYYGDTLRYIREQGRFCKVPYEMDLPVDTYWDIGVRDATCIWYTQQAGKEHRVIDFDWFTGAGLNQMAKKLHEKRYVYGKHWGPHDLAVREIGADYAEARVMKARRLGINFTVVPRRDFDDGIEAGRALLNRSWFDEEKCQLGIDGLHQYRKKKIEGLVGPRGEDLYSDDPDHTWASNPADSWRTGAMGRAMAQVMSDSSGPIKPRIAMI